MPIWKQRILSRYHEAAGDDGSDTAGTGGTPATPPVTPPVTPPATSPVTPPASGDAPKPTDAEAKLLKEVMQKKDLLTKSSADLATAQEALKAFEGIDPVAVRKLLTEQKDNETKAMEAAGEWKTLKERMSQEHTTATATLKAENQTLKDALGLKETTINDLSIGSRFSASNFIADELVLTPAKARIVYGEHFDLVDGKVVGFDKPRGAANRTPLIDQHGNNVDFEAALRKVVELDPDKDHMIKSKVKTGAGSSGRPVGDIKPPAGKTDSLSRIAGGLSALKIGQ